MDADEILRIFCDDIDATGGVIAVGTEDDPDGKNTLYAPVADQDWLDLGDTYRLACKHLERDMLVLDNPEETPE